MSVRIGIVIHEDTYVHVQKVTGRCTTIFTRVVLLEFKQPSLEAWRYKIAVSAKWWSVVLPVVYTSGHVLGEKHM